LNQSIQTKLKELFEAWAGEPAITINLLPPSGSYRYYYRITGETKIALGAQNEDLKENKAFIEFTRFFLQKGLRVPEIYAVCPQQECYLLEDFGNTTLYDWLSTSRTGKEIPSEILTFYRQSLEQLVHFQIEGTKGLDYSHCYPRHSFDKQSMMWDLHYFKYYFLKLARIPFDEQLLEDDFNTFSNFLLQANCDYFLYRDFQSRNIMVTSQGPAFIDYQGGRKGALQYDLASLLFDAKANIPESVREELLDYYIDFLKHYIQVEDKLFRNHFYGYVFIRIMQAMGAYGFRGFYEKKEHFLRSIPYALENLSWLLNHVELPIEVPALMDALREVTQSERLKNIGAGPTLVVTVNSFSYRRGIPIDYSGHGGGFVFDCRSIHNPGRYPEYKEKTGQDPEVISFFEKEEEMHDFLKHVYALTDQSVTKYMTRGFKHLMINFGCTGGQHRSVYCAEKMAARLKARFGVQVKLSHLEREMLKRV
jgi:aminoglycoside/choline kinase family phosphotransferase